MECGMNHRLHAFVSSTGLLHQGSMLFTTPRTWHPHIYEPPRKSRRHFISDILGISENSEKENLKKESVKENDLIRSYTCKCEGCFLRTSTCDIKKEIKEESDPEDSRKRSSDDNCSDPNHKKKKARTTFTGRQIFELEKQFEQKKYLSSAERAEMATMLNVTETQVKIWFQNRRTKWKKQENISNAEAAELKLNVEKSTDVSKKHNNMSTAKKNKSEEKISLAFEIDNKDTQTEVKSEIDPAISEVMNEKFLTKPDVYSNENMAETLLGISKTQMSHSSSENDLDVQDDTGGM
ncbi:uncharacterized protein [Mytilus edulis]|uniref:uncharacterized protein n=1 Tax=Mytilus edulis TaxID=6550 RepID=UPI0039EEE540